MPITAHKLQRALVRPRNCLAVTLCLFTPLALADAPRCENWAAQLVSMEGEVDWRADAAGDWQPAQLHAYFCHGDLIRVATSRAALRLSNETVVRLSERSQLKLLPQDRSFWVELKAGAAHFLSRTPRDFTVSAPYVNASVDGTEFVVAHRAERDTVTVLEGQVTARNAYGAVSLTQLEQAYAVPDAAPQKHLEIDLRDAVRWTLHYPQLSSLYSAVPATIAQLAASGEVEAARAEVSALPESTQSVDLQNLLTSLDLHSGRIEAARAANRRALALDSSSADALAMRAMMQLAEGERSAAAEQTAELIQRYPRNPSVWLVRSYALQAQFELEQAYTAARQATALSPQDSALWLRAAELALNLDRRRDADEALEKVTRLSPASSDAQLLTGVMALKKRKFTAAHQHFADVVTRDSGNALGHFMLGLADIRLGNVESGRRQLELAALLDPNNSLFRSYLGKAYFEERRFPLADTQYHLAKALDPDDPTPYFYAALQQQFLNRPHLAFEEIEVAVAKNDNRALFRSRLQLDTDEAARVASQAAIYRKIGLEERAQFLAGQATATAPGAHGGHRMMAESLSGNSLADSARASEILQAQVTQPLHRKPIRFFPTEQSQFSVGGLGLTEIGPYEFSNLFEQPDLGLEATAAKGGNDTELLDLYMTGTSRNAAGSLGWHEQQNGGFRAGTAVDNTVGELYLQYQPLHHSTFRVQMTKADTRYGNLYDSALPSALEPTINTEKREDNLWAAYTYSGRSIQSTIMITSIDKDEATTEIFGAFPEALGVELEADNRIINTQFQSVINGQHFNVIAGASYRQLETTTATAVTFNGIPAFDPTSEKVSPDDSDLYTYLYLFPSDSVSLVFGGKQSWYTDVDSFDPKFALKYQFTDGLALTAAAFKALNWRTDLDRSLEPTNLLGIIQKLDQIELTRSETFALSLTHNYRSSFYAGVEATRSENLIPTTADVQQTWDETAWNAYALLKFSSASLKLSLHETKSEHAVEAGSTWNVPRLRSFIHVPLEFRYFFTSGLHAALFGHYREHEFRSIDNTEEDTEQYATIDLRLEYHFGFASRFDATISAAALNLTNNKFDMRFASSHSDPTPHLWPVAPERYGLVELSIRY